MITKKIDSVISLSILVIFTLILFSIVPNSFAISLIGSALCLILIFLKQPLSPLDKVTDKLSSKIIFAFIFSWVAMIILAGCINAWARFVSPGYDLYWFTQAISQAAKTGVLKTSSERFYTTILMQHWEPILYLAVPFAFLIKSSIVSMLWQNLGFALGAMGAYKLSNYLFSKTPYPRMQYVTTAFYVLSFSTINPLSFDVHPPVFGGLFFIPWILYTVLSQKNKLIPIILILLLAQCGEIFLAVFTTYLAYLIVEKNTSLLRIILAIITILSGYILVSLYQKYWGPWWSGLPYNYARRYGNIGGDGFGIISNFLHNPLYVLSQLFEKEKIKTFLKIFLYSGPFFIFAFKSTHYKKVSFFILLGCVPYFLQAGLTSYNLLYATNTHYISALGSQWWALTTIGLHAFVTENYFIKLKSFCMQTSIAAFVFLFLFLNTSEWHKSPLYPIRGLLERDTPSKEVRNYFTTLDKEKGLLFVGTEWLCPLAAFGRTWLICNDGSGYFDKMPLNIIIARDGSLEQYYDNLTDNLKYSLNGYYLHELISEKNNLTTSSNWHLVLSSQQKPYKNIPIHYSIYERR